MLPVLFSFPRSPSCSSDSHLRQGKPQRGHAGLKLTTRTACLSSQNKLKPGLKRFRSIHTKIYPRCFTDLPHLGTATLSGQHLHSKRIQGPAPKPHPDFFQLPRGQPKGNVPLLLVPRYAGLASQATGSTAREPTCLSGERGGKASRDDRRRSYRACILPAERVGSSPKPSEA